MTTTRTLILTLLLLAVSARARTWTDTQGRSFDGLVLEVAGGTAQILRADDQRLYPIAVERFGAADQLLLRAHEARRGEARRVRAKVVQGLAGGARVRLVELRWERTGYKVERGIAGEQLRKRDPYASEWVEYPLPGMHYLEDLTVIGQGMEITLWVWPREPYEGTTVLGADTRLQAWRPWP